MLYIERDSNGYIVGVHTKATATTNEQKSIMDEEIIDFLNRSVDTDPWMQLLSLSDIGIIRILEDLVDILIKKNVIRFTDLPEEAQKKIQERKQIRQKLTPEQLVIDEDDIL